MNLGSARRPVPAPHSFGMTSVLDNFNRANEQPLGAASGGDTWGTDKWRSDPFGDMTVNANKLVFRAVGATQGSQALLGSYGPDSELSFTVESYSSGTSDILWALIRGAVTGVEQCNGYGMYIAVSTGAGGSPPQPFDIGLIRYDAGSMTFLKIGRIGGVAFGDSFGLSAVGSVITAWYKPTGSSVWQARLSVVDSTYSGAGRIGLALDDPFTLENLCGGTR